MWMPAVLGCMIGVFGLVQLLSPVEKWRHPPSEVIQKVVMIFTLAYSFMSIFFIRTIVQSFVCTDETPSYMHSQPDVECNLERECSKEDIEDGVCYTHIFALATSGMIFYACFTGAICFGITCFRDWFYFWTDKNKPQFFYWEVLLVARKVPHDAHHSCSAYQAGMGY